MSVVLSQDMINNVLRFNSHPLSDIIRNVVDDMNKSYYINYYEEKCSLPFHLMYFYKMKVERLEYFNSKQEDEEISLEEQENFHYKWIDAETEITDFEVKYCGRDLEEIGEYEYYFN